MSDSRDLVLDFWKNKGTYIETYGFAYSKEDIKVLLAEVKKQSVVDFAKKINVLIDCNSPEISLDKIYNLIKKELRCVNK